MVDLRMFDLLFEDSSEILIKLVSSIHTTSNGSSLPDLLLHILHSPDIPELISKVSLEILLGPAVWSLPDLRRRPGAVSTQVDVRLGAVLHRSSILGLVHQTRDVRDTNLGCELVDTGWVASLT